MSPEAQEIANDLKKLLSGSGEKSMLVQNYLENKIATLVKDVLPASISQNQQLERQFRRSAALQLLSKDLDVQDNIILISSKVSYQELLNAAITKTVQDPQSVNDAIQFATSQILEALESISNDGKPEEKQQAMENLIKIILRANPELIQKPLQAHLQACAPNLGSIMTTVVNACNISWGDIVKKCKAEVKEEQSQYQHTRLEALLEKEKEFYTKPPSMQVHEAKQPLADKSVRSPNPDPKANTKHVQQHGRDNHRADAARPQVQRTKTSETGKKTWSQQTQRKDPKAKTKPADLGR